MIALKNHLFALGGLTPQGFTHSVERYDLTTNEWEWAAPLSEPRYRHAACVTSRGKVNFFCVIQGLFINLDSTIWWHHTRTRKWN